MSSVKASNVLVNRLGCLLSLVSFFDIFLFTFVISGFALCLDNLKLTERNGTEGNRAEWNKDFIPLFGYFTMEWN